MFNFKLLIINKSCFNKVFSIFVTQNPNLKQMLNSLITYILIVTTTQLTMILIAVASIFIVFILIAIIKMYKLKAENKKLMRTNAFKDYETSQEEYSGHLYGDN